MASGIGDMLNGSITGIGAIPPSRREVVGMSSDPQSLGLTDSDIHQLKKIVATRSRNNSRPVSGEMCRLLRQEMADIQDIDTLAEEWPPARSTVRRHVSGRCSHDISEPAWDFDFSQKEWVRKSGGEADGSD